MQVSFISIIAESANANFGEYAGVNEGLPNKRVKFYTIFGFSFKFYMKYFAFIFCTISSFSFKFDIKYCRLYLKSQ